MFPSSTADLSCNVVVELGEPSGESWGDVDIAAGYGVDVDIIEEKVTVEADSNDVFRDETVGEDGEQKVTAEVCVGTELEGENKQDADA